ncbi:hypothetical protein ACFQ08_09640 [Streptosporangium algeriense]|uniref:Uncharacterized protein n=1 Tax=Streptosporangium algeriense TaxID=1682748 RepID=A0ABW3DM00_9ACTN
MKPYVRPQPLPEACEEQPQEEGSADKPLKPYVKSQARQVAYNTVLRVVA